MLRRRGTTQGRRRNRWSKGVGCRTLIIESRSPCSEGACLRGNRKKQVVILTQGSGEIEEWRRLRDNLHGKLQGLVAGRIVR